MGERTQRGERDRDSGGAGGAAAGRDGGDAGGASAARRGQADDVARAGGGGGGAAPRPEARVSGPIDSTSFERWVQSALNAVGGSYGFGGLEVDGKLSAPTRAATRSFQAKAESITGERLAVDGVVGRQTTAALAGATHSSAPSVRESQRVRAEGGGGAAPTGGGAAPTTGGGAAPTGGGAAPTGGGAAPTGGGAGATHAEQTPTRPGEPDAPAGAPSADARLREERDGAATPGTPRAGAAGQADELRAKFAGGVLVSMTIPDAYENPESVIAEAAATPNGHRGLDGYAYDVHRAAWAGAHMSDADRLWHAARAGAGPSGAALPESYSAATPAQRTRILAALAKSAQKNELKDLMWAAMPQPIARTIVGNNRYIPNSAQGYAAQQHAAAGDTGALVLGKAMYFNKATTDIPGKVTATSAAVGAVLAAHAPASGPAADQAAKDSKVAKVRFLTISSHGAPGWMGGHGAASDAAFRTRDVPAIVGGMASVLAADVRVRLFACHTTRAMTSDESEGTIADMFRDELNKAGKSEGAVIGHTESGDTQTNSTTRFLHSKDKTAKADWRGRQVFTDAWIREFATSLGVSTLTAKQLGKLRTAMVEFFGRECWMEDISDMEHLTASSRERWRARHQTRAQIDRYIGGARS